MGNGQVQCTVEMPSVVKSARVIQVHQAIAIVLMIGWAAQTTLAGQRESTASADTAARQWLARIDAGAYDEAWADATGTIRQLVSSNWTQWMRERRGGLGNLRRRTTICVSPTTTLDNEVVGDYVVIQYDTDFMGASHLFEYVETERSDGGAWKVRWYFVRKRGLAESPHQCVDTKVKRLSSANCSHRGTVSDCR